MDREADDVRLHRLLDAIRDDARAAEAVAAVVALLAARRSMARRSARLSNRT